MAELAFNCGVFRIVITDEAAACGVRDQMAIWGYDDPDKFLAGGMLFHDCDAALKSLHEELRRTSRRADARDRASSTALCIIHALGWQNDGPDEPTEEGSRQRLIEYFKEEDQWRTEPAYSGRPLPMETIARAIDAGLAGDYAEARRLAREAGREFYREDFDAPGTDGAPDA